MNGPQASSEGSISGSAVRRDGPVSAAGVRESRRTVLFVERNVDGTIGGSYRSLLYLVRLLPRDRWRAVVVFYRHHELVDAYRAAGAQVLLLQYPQTVDLFASWPGASAIPGLRPALRLAQKALNLARGALPLLWTYIRLLRRERVDLVHLNNGVMSGTQTLLASRLLNIPTVVHQRGIGPLPASFKYVRPLIDHVISVSDAARDNLVRQGLPPETCTTVHNGIDPEEFTASVSRDPEEVRRSLGIPAGALVVGNAGMIRHWKGQRVLVEAMVRVHAQVPGAYCLLVGGISDTDHADQEYLQGLQTFVREHGLSDRVIFAGYQSRVVDFMQIFDVMVHTSIDPEPFSRSVLEGMALGRAMVGTRTGGTPEAIEEGVSGLLVTANDSEAMATAITRLLQSDTLRRSLGAAAQRRIRERFGIDVNVASTAEVYQRLLRDR